MKPSELFLGLISCVGSLFISSASGMAATDTPYATRVDKFWQWFAKNRIRIEKLLNDEDPRSLHKINDILTKGSGILGKNLAYNVGGEYEITFCVEDHPEYHYIYPYLVENMPEYLRGSWKAYPCKPRYAGSHMTFEISGMRFDIDELMVRSDYDEENKSFVISYYHPDLVEFEESQSAMIFVSLLEMVIGEGPVYNYVADIVRKSDADEMFPISQLYEKMRFALYDNGESFSQTPQLPYCGYSFNADAKETRFRFDIVSGVSQFMKLNEEYLEGRHDIYDSLAAMGVRAVMLMITQPADMDAKEFLAFRHDVEDRLEKMFDNNEISGRLIGGAYGSGGVAYIDLLLYDDHQFVNYFKDQNNKVKLIRYKDRDTDRFTIQYKDFIQDAGPLNL